VQNFIQKISTKSDYDTGGTQVVKVDTTKPTYYYRKYVLCRVPALML
jgi:hypothetical protein